MLSSKKADRAEAEYLMALESIRIKSTLALVEEKGALLKMEGLMSQDDGYSRYVLWDKGFESL